MKFTASTILSIAALQISTVLGGVVLKRVTPSQVDCIGAAKSEGFNPNFNDYSAACAALVANCFEEAKSTTYIWHKTSCVAAATCQGVRETVIGSQCANNAIPVQASVPDLSTNIYSGIVHGCSGCSMTQQNYIDFVYGALSAINSTSYPTSAQQVIDEWWTPLLNWTATGDVVPYQNFDDFLHYVGY